MAPWCQKYQFYSGPHSPIFNCLCPVHLSNFARFISQDAKSGLPWSKDMVSPIHRLVSSSNLNYSGLLTTHPPTCSTILMFCVTWKEKGTFYTGETCIVCESIWKLNLWYLTIKPHKVHGEGLDLETGSYLVGAGGTVALSTSTCPVPSPKHA